MFNKDIDIKYLASQNTFSKPFFGRMVFWVVMMFSVIREFYGPISLERVAFLSLLLVVQNGLTY